MLRLLRSHFRPFLARADVSFFALQKKLKNMIKLEVFLLFIIIDNSEATSCSENRFEAGPDWRELTSPFWPQLGIHLFLPSISYLNLHSWIFRIKAYCWKSRLWVGANSATRKTSTAFIRDNCTRGQDLHPGRGDLSLSISRSYWRSASCRRWQQLHFFLRTSHAFHWLYLRWRR